MSLLLRPIVIISAAVLIMAPASWRLCAQESSAVQAAGSSGSLALSAAEPLPEAPQAAKTRSTPSGSQAPAQQPAIAGQQSATVNGTVTDSNGDLIPGANVTIDGPSPADHRTATANGDGEFQFGNLKPGVAYRITAGAKGFTTWTSSDVVLTPGQYLFLPQVQLTLVGQDTSVTVSASTASIATQQVQIEEQQRVLGFIPNYYVVYDKDAVPLTPKLKFELAFKVSIDPINFLGAAVLGGANQAADTPNYPQGAKGYAERVGASYTDGVTDIMFGGAILPTLLHQDPRYYYQGTGTTRSRLFHALSYPFACRGDNGKIQPNYSTIGGDLISSAISNAYYPPSNRGADLVFENLGISTGERALSTVLQEFVLRRFTPKAKQKN